MQYHVDVGINIFTMDSNLTNSGPSPGFIVNEILCYIQNMVDVLPVNTVVKICEGYLNVKETKESRDILISSLMKNKDSPLHAK